MGDVKDTSAANVAADQDIDLVGEEVLEVSNGVLNSAGVKFMGRVMRFLVAVQSPAYWAKALREGYTTEEHLLGWKLLRLAGGESREMDHLVEEVGSGAPIGVEQGAALQQIDAFENLWFPRVRGIIRRVVPRAHRDTFAEAFFKDIEQQPYGPGVVRTVSTLLTRLEGLATSSQPGAKEVFAMVEKRGLSPKRRAHMRSVLAQVESPGAPAKKNATIEQVVQTQDEQTESLASLRDWFNDWGVTLRPVFSARAQITLGLTVLARGRADDEAPAAPPGIIPSPT